jgi:hypothetical protein
MNKSHNKNHNKSHKTHKPDADRKTINLPPAINLTHTVSTILRYQVSTGNYYTISVANIASALGTTGTSSTTVQPWCSSFRIKRVRIYPSSSGSVDEYAGLSWTQGLTGFVKDTQMNKEIPIGMTVPSSVSFTPPAKSLASDWISSTNSGNIFRLHVGTGDIIDLSIVYTLQSGVLTPFASQTVSASGIGDIFYLALDGPSSNNIVPVQLSTTS